MCHSLYNFPDFTELTSLIYYFLMPISPPQDGSKSSKAVKILAVTPSLVCNKKKTQEFFVGGDLSLTIFVVENDKLSFISIHLKIFVPEQRRFLTIKTQIHF